MARLWPRQMALRNLRPQLRLRIMAAFGLGAFALSTSVGATAYFAARSTIVGQAVSTAETSAQSSLQALKAQIAQSTAGVTQQYLLSLDATASGVPRSASALYPSLTNPNRVPVDDFYGLAGLNPPVSVTTNDLPASLLSLTSQDYAAEQIFSADGQSFIGVGLSIPQTDSGATDSYDSYFVIFPTVQEVHTLDVLLAALVIAAAVATVLGAIVGRWAARRALSPLRRAALAASAIASGELNTRIETRDASDLRVLATSFNSMVDALQSRIAREARFTSDVAHELRSPLTTLATALSVIESRRDELTTRSQHALDLLSEEVKRFRILVTDLLEISRVDAKVDPLSESLVEVRPLITNALENSGAEDVPVTIDEETAHRWLFVDKRRIERIVTNLIQNGERYGGGVTGVRIESEGDHVRISVDDDGPGVPTDERERIFDRFARGATAAGSRGLGGGSGLGLALVSEHVKVHGGRVWVEDAPSGGARFVVELPFAPDELLAEMGDEGPDEADGGVGWAGVER